MRRTLESAYGLMSYVIFAISIVWLIPFLGNVAVPKTVDTGGAESPFAVALIVNLVLIAVFSVQHSAMARLAFKKRWTKVISPRIERSTYVLLAGLLLLLLLWQWRPMPGVIWHVENAVGSAILTGLFWAAWALELITWIPNHFDLFGVRQAFLGDGYAAPEWKITTFNRYVRQLPMTAYIIGFWATPRMTVGHLVLAITMAVYILGAIYAKERDMTSALGEPYVKYKKATPMLIPLPRRKQA
jgi:protein-S-isoprenylcysteine O-methyltransferase Ste14